MKRIILPLLLLTLLGGAISNQAAVYTVTSTNATVLPGFTNLTQAIQLLQDGDTINFNITTLPGQPVYIPTPSGGYPLITKNNVTIDGYSQPGAAPNTNTILAANTAKLKIVLDSRNGNSRLLDFPGDTPNDDTGYGDTESAVIGILQATNVNIRGLCILAVPLTGPSVDVSVYGISFAKGANGHVSGCWIGVDLNGRTDTFIAPADALTGFRYRGRDENNTVTNTILVSSVTVGVGKNAANPRAEFNVIAGEPAIPIILEGQNHRISGNFLGVLPNGMEDFNVAMDPVLTGNFEGFIEIGRAGNNTVIGVDGDGVNDAEERNVFGGTLPPNLGGYDHSIEFYGQSPGTNIIVAGNYIGIAIDGITRFTNGVPPLNAPSGGAQYRFGSDFNGVSDSVEGNVVYNNWPPDMFDPTSVNYQPDFFDELADTTSVSLRGNVLVNNFTPPVNPLKNGGQHVTNYYSRVIAEVTNGIVPLISGKSSVARLVGTVPLPNTNYPVVMIDVYVADREGITNGIAAGIPELPDGYVQGKTYLASFVLDGAGDMNPVPGAFEFDLSALAVGTNTPLTVTANYSKDPPGTSNGRTITSLFSPPFTPRAPILVTTTNSTGAGSLHQAMTGLQDGDVIRFNIPGPGPNYISTPAGGYPYITANYVTIDGFSQPGAVPNTNPILAPNNAQLKIVLDSRNGNTRLMDYPGDTPNDDTGYGDTESAVIGIIAATNVTIRGLDILSAPLVGSGLDISAYGISFAKGANGRVSGCWIGVDLNGQTATFIAPAVGVSGFRYRGRDENNVTTNTILINGVVVGVPKGSANAPADFNVITGVPGIPVILEGNDSRISGNFIGVLPDGVHDFNPAFDPVLAGNFEGNIEIGRGGNNTLIGVDGDGINDANERNVFGGVVSPTMSGYDHDLEFYGNNPGTNIVVAGNYFGIGVDGTTRFPNNVPPLNASGGTSQYRFGSDLNGVGDAFEGNVAYNNWPARNINDAVLSFFDEISIGARVSVRGNVLVNNYTPPIDPLRTASQTEPEGSFMTNYYATVLESTTNGVIPVVSSNSTVSRLIGTVPRSNTNNPVVMVDLYLPDPEGIATGKTLDPSLYPEGWIQGKTYLGTYVVDGAADLNPAAGAFEFDISALNLSTNTAVTVTANYSGTPPGTSNGDVVTSLFSVPVPLGASVASLRIGSVVRNGSNLNISWSGGTPPYQVERRANFSGAGWVPEGAPTSTTSASVPITGSEGYFRVVGH